MQAMSTDTAPANGTPAEARGELAVRTLAMPADTNPSGDVFGGWLMSLMDVAGGGAGRRPRRRRARPLWGRLRRLAQVAEGRGGRHRGRRARAGPGGHRRRDRHGVPAPGE